MAPDTNLQFIREKLYQLRSAVMYNNSNGIVRIPNNIVHLVRVDEDGDIWFVARNASENIRSAETSFPARLHFYRKGTYFFVEVSGKATVEEFGYKGDERIVLMKMKLSNVEYTAALTEEPGILEKNIRKAYQWLLRNLSIPNRERSVFPKVQQPSL